MPRTEPPPTPHPRAESEPERWPDDGWSAHHHDEDASNRARQLLSSQTRFHHLADGTHSLLHWLSSGRWLPRLVLTVSVLGALFAACFGGLWLRLGAGPISLDLATPWLVAAIEQNLGNGNTVEIGGTQIERAGRIRVAVRIRNIVVRDRERAIVATAPKAEVRLSGAALLMGRLRAESLKLVDAELAIRITPDGEVTVSTGDTARPLATGVAKPALAPPPTKPSAPASGATPSPGAPAAAAGRSHGRDEAFASLLAGLDWLDSLNLSGLDGQNLNEIGLKSGNLIVDDQQSGNRLTFENVALSLRRPSGGGIVMSVGEEAEAGDDPKRAWSLRVAVGPQTNGVRPVELRANNVSTKTILLALRLKDFTYTADLPLSGELKGELGRDGVPTFFRGKLVAGAGHITDLDTPEYPMPIDQAELSVEWDAGRRVLVAPFKVVAGGNRVTLLAHLEPPNDRSNDWQLGLSGGTIVLPGSEQEPPLIFNRIAIGIRFDTDAHRMTITQANISNGEIGVAGSGFIDYAGEPRLTLGFTGTPMSVGALKRMWPILIVPELREWVIERIARGAIQRIDIAVNSPFKNLSRRGPPIPDEGLAVNIVATGAMIRPVDEMPAIREGDLKAVVTGRTATVTIGQAVADTAQGRRLTMSDIVFEVPDMAPKPAPAKVKFRVEGQVAAVAEILASDRLSDVGGALIDPNTSKGMVAAQVAMGMPIKRELTKADTSYAVTADLTNFSAEKLVMNQKLEANALKVVANTQGFQIKGDVKINGQAAALEYRKPSEGDAEVKLQATLDDASRARLGFDLGSGLSGAIPVKLSGKISEPDRETRLGIDADLTAAKVDNVLPGWVKAQGKSSRAVFTLLQRPQATRFEDIVIEGAGANIKGALEVDENGDLVNANFPNYAPSEGDKATLKAERAPDGVMKVTMRGDVFDGRGFIKSAISGRDNDAKSKSKAFDVDIDVKLGVVAGYFGETLRSVDAKLSRRNGAIRSFALNGKLGRDTSLTGDLRGRVQGREVIYLETNDAGSFFRFTDTYGKMYGGQLSLAMDPPVSDPREREGLLNVRDFTVKGETQLDRVVASGAQGANQGANSGLAFSRLRAEFTRQNGQLTIREGVVKGPMIGATIEGSIDYPGNQVRMSGTFVPMYGLNNMFGQIPVVGLFLGGGSNEGLIGVTYEVVGTPGSPVLRVNPISAMAPGVLRKIFEFGTGRQNNPNEFPSPNN